MEKKDIGELACLHTNPYMSNIYVNADESAQKSIKQSFSDSFDISGESKGRHYSVLHYDGMKIMKDLAVISEKSRNWALQQCIPYTEVDELYRLMQITILKLKKHQLEQCGKDMQGLEANRSKDRDFHLNHILVESYLTSLILSKMAKADSRLTTLDNFYVKKGILSQALEMNRLVLEGSVEEIVESLDFANIPILIEITSDLFSNYRAGFFNLIENGQVLMDRDVMGLLNTVISWRISACSMNIMTSLDGLYSRLTSGGHFNQAIYDLRVIDIQRLIKDLK